MSIRLTPKTTPSIDAYILIYSHPNQLSSWVDEIAAKQMTERGPLCIGKYYAQGAHLFIIRKAETGTKCDTTENYRRCGHKLYKELQATKVLNAGMRDLSDLAHQNTYALLEGLSLSCYEFTIHKSKHKKTEDISIEVPESFAEEPMFSELPHIVSSVNITRDLVNEPSNILTAEELADRAFKLGRKYGFDVEILDKAQLQEMGMGGLLSVNKGAVQPPTFSILSYKPAKAVNKHPIVLVGKGVVYDTGGLSLKPTQGSMDIMKCDMAGAATVIGAMCAIAANELPINIIGLLPATENRPGGDAYAPGDIIKMYDGTTVEVMDTDAEGRIILADALSYAKKYSPSLVIDLATLTGSALRAIGREGIVYMGTASKNFKSSLEAAGDETYERLVEFPLWKEYAETLKSDIADIKNLGGPEAGAITAGKFLEHFIDYEWLHLDIAGPAFLPSEKSYMPKYGTGIGVRLLYTFLKNFVENGK